MPHFDTFTLIRWAHIAAMALGGGCAMLILILVGFEETREDLEGLTAVLWKRTAAWAFRIAFALGLVLLGMLWQAGAQPMTQAYLHLKLPLAILLLAASEMSPKALAAHKRGAPLLAFFLFLVVSFVTVNRSAFPQRAAAEAAQQQVR